MMKNKGSEKPNQKSADTSAEDKVRKIIDEATPQDQHGNQYLAEVVCKTAADTDAGSTKKPELFYKLHDKQTKCSSGKTVEKHGEIAEGQCRQKNPYKRNSNGRTEVKAVQCDDDNEVCQTELNSGNHAF